MQNPYKRLGRRIAVRAEARAAAARYERALRGIVKAGFWFIDIPRTSSTSIKAELGIHFGSPFGKANIIEREFAQKHVIPDHITAKTLRDQIGQEAWGRLYTFTIVRNPWDRARSLFYYLKTRSEIPDVWRFSDWIRLLVDDDVDLPFVAFHAIRRSAFEFIQDVDGTILVDEIVRYEDREAGLRCVAQRLGIGNFGNLRLQSSQQENRAYRSDYDDYTRRLIERRFERDIALFDYEF